MTSVGVLESEDMKYIASVLDSSLRQVGDRLKERFASVEYELFPFDSNRVVITFGAERLKKEGVGELELQVVDSTYYSLSLGDLKVNDKTLEGEVECHTWSGPLVMTASPTEFYMADVKLVLTDKFSVRLSFNTAEDVGQISHIIYKFAEVCESKVKQGKTLKG